jgi:hypothetical protein
MLSPAKFWKLGRLAILALSILMTLGLSISHAMDFILTPTADARVSANNPNTNYGTDQYLVVSRSGPPIYAYDDFSYLKFDLSIIPASYRIIGGTLSLYCSNTPGTGTAVGLRPVADKTWSEMGITWNNKPAFGNPITGINVGTGWNSWTIPKANLPATGLVSFMLMSDIPAFPNSFYSKEFGSYPPKLAVTVVKKMAPAAINLLLLGN